MAFSAPFTAVAGAIFTAAQYNTNDRDNMIYVHATPFNCCVAFNSAAQTIGGGPTALNLNSEEIDTASMHDTVTNNPRITIPTGGGGGYMIFGQSLPVGGNGSLHLQKNGTTVRTVEAVSGTPTWNVMAYLVLVATDYVQLAGEVGFDVGHATAARSTRLSVIGPWPPT